MQKFLKYVFMVPLVFLVVCGLTTAVWAIPITMQFTAAGFSLIVGSGSVPTDPVTGTIVWDAASVNSSTINSLSSITLTIDTHAYGLGEIDYMALTGADAGKAVIGGSLNTPLVIVAGTDDFWIIWNIASSIPVELHYTSSKPPNDEGIWGASQPNFRTFSITAIPEPATMLLLGTGLVGLVGFRRKFKK